MKTINVKDITDVEAKDIKPGHILMEGIVLESHSQTDHNKGKVLCYFFDTAAEAAVYADEGQIVQVLGKVTQEMVTAIKDTIARSMVG